MRQNTMARRSGIYFNIDIRKQMAYFKLNLYFNV